jgi:hypothetical protein
MKATSEQIKEILGHLENGLSVIRKNRDRGMMRETVIRIRQLRGILEVRAA